MVYCLPLLSACPFGGCRNMNLLLLLCLSLLSHPVNEEVCGISDGPNFLEGYSVYWIKNTEVMGMSRTPYPRRGVS